MNLVEQVARMLDREGAYSVWYGTTSTDGKPLDFTTRQKYFQAVYEHLAVDILKFALNTGPSEIRKALVEFEKDGWRELGVPIDNAQISDEAHRIIEAKYK